VVAGLVVRLSSLRRTPPAATAGIALPVCCARTISGHVSASALGAVAIAIHTLAAAMWCGTLAALVLTVEHRGQWARVLPRFSELSLLCVIALLAGGLTGALVAVDSVSQLFATGYGRVLLIKIVLTVVLIALAWRNRPDGCPRHSRTASPPTCHGPGR
jgi:putative copper resistance protein D